MATWQYARLQLNRDPGNSMEATGFLLLPGDGDWRELGVVQSLFGLVTDLGRDGWEMVGMPLDVNSVFTYQAANATWHDRAYFVEREFWFKREAS